MHLLNNGMTNIIDDSISFLQLTHATLYNIFRKMEETAFYPMKRCYEIKGITLNSQSHILVQSVISIIHYSHKKLTKANYSTCCRQTCI